MRTGVIRGGGTPVFVRRAAGVESADDPLIADGGPVLVSAGGSLQVGGQPWRAVRGLSGIVGWVPSTQVSVDGEAPLIVAGTGAAATPGGVSSTVLGSTQKSSANALGTPTSAPALAALASSGERMRVANTDGVGVVLRTSPRDEDKTTRGLMDGASVSVLERTGSDWVHVHADNGQDGWIPTRYVVPAL
jgi:SH3-like domain-containing protein